MKFKAEKAGTHFVEVNPRDTTKECSECGVKTDKEIWVREHSCPSCGYTADRDYNASQNILQRGLDNLGLGYSEVMPAETVIAVEANDCREPDCKSRLRNRKPLPQRTSVARK